MKKEALFGTPTSICQLQTDFWVLESWENDLAQVTRSERSGVLAGSIILELDQYN